MSLDKAIEHKKEKRKPYRGSKAIDCTCRNHGSCDWCKANRLHKFRDKKPPEIEMTADMNREKYLFLTSEQIQMLGGCDENVIVIPDEMEEEKRLHKFRDKKPPEKEENV